MTYRDLDPRYRVIAYVVALTTLETLVDATENSVREIREACDFWWPVGFADVTADAFRALVDEMVGLGVLTRVEEGMYRLRSTNVLRMLGSASQIEERLLETEGYRPPDKFQSASYRRPISRDADQRSPLSEAQVARLERSGVVSLLYGTEATNVNSVPEALKDAGSGAGFDVSVVKSGKASIRIPKPEERDRSRIVLVDCREVALEGGTRILEIARSSIDEDASLGVVLLMDARQLPFLHEVIASRSVEPGDVIALRPWDRDGLRSWLSEAVLPFQGDDGVEELMTMTGGWPTLVDAVVEEWRRSNDRRAAAAEVDRLLTDADRARDLIRSVGLVAEGPLAAAFRTFVELDIPEQPDQLALALEEDGDPRTTIDLLRIASVLTPNPKGELAPDPVIVRAWSAASSS